MMGVYNDSSKKRFGARSLRLTAPAVILGVMGILMFSAGTALAAGPIWTIRSVAVPTRFTKVDNAGCSRELEVPCDGYVLTITNTGTGTSSGTITVRDKLPSGIVVAGIGSAVDTVSGEANTNCPAGVGASTVTCTDTDELGPQATLTIYVEVTAEPELEGSVSNVAEVQGGGAAPAVTSEPSTAANSVGGEEAAGFGIQDFGVAASGPSGLLDVQAGDHPAMVTTNINYNTVLNKYTFRTNTLFLPPAEPKTTIVDLPLGFVGSALAAPTCPEVSLIHVDTGRAKCPAASVVGEVNIEEGYYLARSPIYSVVPEAGYPVEFAFEFDEALFYFRSRVVPSPGGYDLSVAVPDLQRSTTAKISGATVMFYGNPTEFDGSGNGLAMLTNPADCSAGPLSARVEMNSWVDPEDWVSREAAMYAAGPGVGVTGCGSLVFEPSLEVTPEEKGVDSPSGYEVVLRVPQAREVPGVLATPDLRDATVSLPAGVSISPSAADGLEACQETGPEGINITHGWTPTGAQPLDPADPEAMVIGEDGLPHVAAGHCPNGSEVGEVEVVTPLLAEPLHGHVFVAEPLCGGEGQPACTEASATNGELYGLYLEVAGSGIIVKLKGSVSANPVTGQLTTSFRENPEFPFSELKLKLDGGERAPLANPQTGGVFTTSSDLVPWSSPETPDASPVSSFPLSGPAVAPFVPGFEAGAVEPVAAGSGAFSTLFARSDGMQDLAGVQVTLPPGLVGLLSEVTLCGEPQAQEGKCGAGSLIGSTTVAAGAGPHPFWETGKVFLTGPYGGAPFGLSVVVPAKAGPFNLGEIVVRAAISINPETTAVTVTSGALPQIVDGVPLRVKTVNVLVDKPGFIVNPTNCGEMSVSGTLAGSQGARVGVSSPFAVEGCKSLGFTPVFSASTAGRASKADGASLDVKVSYPKGGEANIKSVKTTLPLQLPSRLTTLQKACVAAVFEANPALCPAESVVGVARAQSPILPVELKGPAYLVSHGNEKFPNLVIVLQGDGVRVNLVGDTDIKHGITTTTFKSVPDDPVSSFEVFLPQGKYSILGTYLPVKDNYDLCGHKLVMPTEIVGQNGAVIRQNTAIAVTGCKPAKKPKTKKNAKKAKKADQAGAGRSSGGGRS
jgi:hypothetical protein